MYAFKSRKIDENCIREGIMTGGPPNYRYDYYYFFEYFFTNFDDLLRSSRII